jgi:hypothetical protein
VPIDTFRAAPDSRRLVLRSLIAVAAVICSVSAAETKSQVFQAQDDQAIERFEERPERSRAMVDALVLAVTGQADLAKAWRTLVSPADRVGIKVSTAGGPSFSSHRGVVAAIVAGLGMAGVPRERIVIWDRNSAELRAAGFLPRGREVVGIDPPQGFDREAQINLPMLGKLIWGDVLFAEKQRVPFGKQRSDGDQLSPISHLARVVSRDVTKIINVPVLSDHRGCGVAGAIYNVTIPNVDNWRRFLQTEGPISTSPAELYADERIGPKCVLHIMDALVAQYAGGPAFEPNYAFEHRTIYASKDPVALDSRVLRLIQEWRALAKLPSTAKQGAWLEDAERMGLGNAAKERIEEPQVFPAR